METNDRIDHLESDIKILKGEVQAVLLDLRDKYLEVDNPFNTPPRTTVAPQVTTSQESAAKEEKPSTVPQSSSVKKEVPEKVQESTIVSEAVEAVMETHAETRRDEEQDEVEVVQTRTPKVVYLDNKPKRNHNAQSDINLITIGGLMNWADESVKRLGQQKTETILDVAEMMGLLSPDLNRILIKFIGIKRDDIVDSDLARDYLDSLMKITTLLGKDNKTEEALLAILPGKGSRG